MGGGVKALRVKAGCEQEFEGLFGQLREEVRAAEPGCQLYALLRSRKGPRDYVVHEPYAGQAALDADERSAHGAAFFPKIRALLASITVEYFDGVADQRGPPRGTAGLCHRVMPWGGRSRPHRLLTLIWMRAGGYSPSSPTLMTSPSRRTDGGVRWRSS